MRKAIDCMKIKYSVVILILSLLLFGCEESKYDTLDFYSSEPDVVLEEPLNFTVQNGNNYITAFWNYPKNQTISVLFSLYRSEIENADFKLLADDISVLYYHDDSVDPGKVYYYKVRAKSILYGESDFSVVKSGKRNGRGMDDYDKADGGNNEKKKSTRIEFNKVYKSSLYISHDATADDCDYYVCNAKKGDILKITMKSPEDSSAVLYTYDITIDSDSKTITSAKGQSLTFNGNSYVIFFARNTSVYICISPDSTSAALNKTGDYDLVVEKMDSSELFSVYSSNYISYVKIFWSSYFSSMASKYIVQRRIHGTEEWENIEGALSAYRLDVQKEFSQNVTAMYDRSAEIGISYDYRVAAYLETKSETESYGVPFYSSIVENAKRYEVQKNPLPEGSADNISFDTALRIELGKIIEGAIDTTDNRYYKVALEANKSYLISIIPDSLYGKVLFGADFFSGSENSQKTRLNCIKPEEASSNYGTFSYTVGESAAGDYWLRIDGNNTLGKYSVIVKEIDS